MILRLMLLAAAIALTGCAHRGASLPGCEGSARRPANPHGSVLAPATTPPGQVTTTPPAATGGCA
jgi:hypothetical protein